MFTQEEILTALQSGMDPQALAKDFTDKLNAAIKQDKEAKEAALKASKVKEDRIFALEQIVDNVADFVKKFYPDMYNEKMFNSIKCEDLDKAIADAYDETMKMTPMFDALKDLQKKMEAADAVFAVKKSTPNTDKAINDFLKRYGLN